MAIAAAAVCGISWVSSRLLRLEVRRTAIAYVAGKRLDAGRLAETDARIIESIGLLPISREVLDTAFAITQTIKTAESIHLATALHVRRVIRLMVTSDDRLHARRERSRPQRDVRARPLTLTT